MRSRGQYRLMRILIYTEIFWPNYGGSGVVARLLAEGFHALGAQVTVLTNTPGVQVNNDSFELVRGWSWREAVRQARRHDLFVIIGPSLKALAAGLAGGVGCVITHQMMAGSGPSAKLKAWASRLAANAAASEAVRQSFGFAMEVIPNPYDDDIFVAPPPIARDRDLVFVGRIIPEKGLHVLLEAISILRAHGTTPTLTVIGDGPEENAMQALARRLGLADQVRFLGVASPAQVSQELQQHRVFVAPSVWDEPFGIVALEGIACGCIPVVTDSGGLPEAIGHCGLTCRRNDPADLARTLQLALASEAICSQRRQAASAHLERHRKRFVATRFLELARREPGLPPLNPELHVP